VSIVPTKYRAPHEFPATRPIVLSRHRHEQHHDEASTTTSWTILGVLVVVVVVVVVGFWLLVMMMLPLPKMIVGLLLRYRKASRHQNKTKIFKYDDGDCCWG
jgi:hypothetical protein